MAPLIRWASDNWHSIGAAIGALIAYAWAHRRGAAKGLAEAQAFIEAHRSEIAQMRADVAKVIGAKASVEAVDTAAIIEATHKAITDLATAARLMGEAAQATRVSLQQASLAGVETSLLPVPGGAPASTL